MGVDVVSFTSDLNQIQREWYFNHYQECLNILAQYDIDPEDICFVAGMSLSAVNLRENNDVDFVVRSAIRNNIIKERSLTPKDGDGTYSLSENVDLKSDWALCIDVSDDELVQDERYYFRRGSFKVARLEVTFSVKNSIRRDHDRRDISLIEEYILDPVSTHKWDWDIFKEPKKKDNKKLIRWKKFIAPRLKNKSLSIVMRRFPLLLMKMLLNKVDRTIDKFRVWHWKLKYFSIVNEDGGGPILKYPIQNLLARQYDKYGEYDRMDLIVRYMAAEDYFNQNDLGFLLYNKMQHNRINSTNSEDQYRHLIESVATNGFDVDSEVEIDTLGNIIDGAHRVSLALYFKEKEISVRFSHVSKEGNYSIKWFEKHGFEPDQILLIKKKFTEIFQTWGMFFYIIIWPPVQDYFNTIEKDLAKSFKIISSKTYQMTDCFDDFTREIYAIDDIERWKIERKIYAMQPYPKVVHIITIEIPDPKFRKKSLNNHDLSMVCEDLKKKYRDIYSPKVPNYIYDIIIHTGDNYEHNRRITKIIEKHLESSEADPTS